MEEWYRKSRARENGKKTNERFRTIKGNEEGTTKQSKTKRWKISCYIDRK